MKWQTLHEFKDEHTYLLVFERGDEVMATLQTFAVEQGLTAAHFSAIGAFERATLGYFDWERKDYRHLPVDEQVEVVSLLGDVALDEHGNPKIHAHVVLGRADGSAKAGHLLKAEVRPTLELVLTQTPAHLQRKHDPATGLALIRPNGSASK